MDSLKDYTELKEGIIKQLIPDYVPNRPESHYTLQIEVKGQTHFLEQEFSKRELEIAIASKKKDTCPGHDNISYSMIKGLPTAAQEILLKTYNKIWTNEMDLPQEWKITHLTAFLNPRKDKEKEESYRPISLLSCFMKIFNTMIKNRLEWFLKKTK